MQHIYHCQYTTFSIYDVTGEVICRIHVPNDHIHPLVPDGNHLRIRIFYLSEIATPAHIRCWD